MYLFRNTCPLSKKSIVITCSVGFFAAEAVHMLPGYTHNIINLNETENLVTVMWANEIFDSNYPDTYYEEV